MVVVEDQDQDPTMQEDLVDHQVVDPTVNQQLQEQQVSVILEKQMQYPLLLDGVIRAVMVFLENLIHKVAVAAAQDLEAATVETPEEE